MLYELLRYLHDAHDFPRLGTYASFRAAAAFFTAFFLCLFLGPRVIRWLRRLRARDSYTKVGPERRAVMVDAKEGTPTMGGLLTVFAVLLSSLLWASLSSLLVLVGLLVFLGCGAIGFWDDWVKVFSTDRHGIRASSKFLLLGTLAIVAALLLKELAWRDHPELLNLVVPLFKDASLPLYVWFGLPFLALAFLAINGTANAVNLTDGMDGLASGLYVIAGAGMCAVAFVVGNGELADFLFVPHVEGAEELAVLLAASVGAALGFLWFNVAPAQVFMGDVGSLSFGGLLGYAGIAARMELTMILLSGVYLAEIASVIVQVASYKMRKKRVWLCAPIHHHFQKKGVPETRIVAQFWIVGLLLAVFGVVLFKLR
ncbi:MAG: phospho-N-acetylmuramoyl-pentapeptide-transferase [Planctomycetota bacterium]|nr:MAG: phospho-N-acetylmuramoyl-pentapeptide-transferase [Planctomycetota bacterium]